MRILQPKVEVWIPAEDPKDWKDHVARCARVCYASDKTSGNEELVARLDREQHISMMRHRSMYWALPVDSVKWPGLMAISKHNPFIRVLREGQDGIGDVVFVSTNGHYWYDHSDELIELGFTEENQVPHNVMAQTPGRAIMRYTVFLRTQISTSRELNRVSPNNISEQSTRFCNYTKGKFGGHPAICAPWWFELHQCNGLGIDDAIIIESDPYVQGSIIMKDGDWDRINKAYAYQFLEEYGPALATALLGIYLHGCCRDMEDYIELVNRGMKPQDARGKLPLDTCTEVVYTYFWDEWERLFENRVEGKRGVPHPNARKIMEMVKSSIEELYDNELSSVR